MGQKSQEKKKKCFSQRVLNMKALLNWTGRCVNQRCGGGLYGCMFSLMQGEAAFFTGCSENSGGNLFWADAAFSV